METNGGAGSSNRYCQRLGLPPPDLEAALAASDVKLSHLMALALLEEGGPMSIEAIAARLRRLALPPRLAGAADPAALLKSWHGQGPVVRDPVDGLFYLDLLLHHEVGFIAAIASRPAKAGARPEPEELRQPADTEALSQAEVDAAFTGRSFDATSSIRRVAAILDVSGGGPLSLDEVNRRLAPFRGRGRIDETTLKAWRSDLVRVGPDGLLHLDPASPDLAGARREIRRMARPRLAQQARSAGFGKSRATYEAERAAEERAQVDEARRARRALVHVVTSDGEPRAAAVIDAARREPRLFAGQTMADLAAYLESFDFLAGLDVRSSLRALGLDPDRWWLAELRPVQRTFRPSDQRPIAVNLPAIVAATTGRRAIPAPKERTTRGGARAGAGLEARVAREAEALFALYEYGALHGGVRLRRRQGEWLLPVSWSLPGDPDFASFVEAAIRHWVPIEVVLGFPARPGDDPWQGATTISIVEREPQRLWVREGDDVRALDPADVCRLRLADPAAAAAVRPAHTHDSDDRFCRLKVTLDDVEPPVWRLIDVAASVTLAKLHELLQAALGWTNSHLHLFEIGEERIGVPYQVDDMAEGLITRSGRLVRLGDVIDRGITRFAYEYDLGDSWRHTIDVVEVGAERDDANGRARCLDGARACPPEDCGGVGGYARLLEILFDPRHPEFEEVRLWAGGFEPERFDLHAANAAMAAVPWY